MKKPVLLAFIGFSCWISGCSKNSRQSTTNGSPNVVQAAAPASPAHNLMPSDSRAGNASGAPAVGGLTPEATQALEFINRSFVASDCTIRYGGSWTICSRNGVLSVAGDKLVIAQDFEDHYANGTVKNSHETESVAIADLDADSLKVQDNDFEGATDDIKVSCQGGKKCTSAVETSSEGPKQFSHDQLTVGNFSRKDVNEVASYLKQLLALQQGKTASAIEREPSEEEAVAYLRSHFAPTTDVGAGITAFHRSLQLEDDELVETQELVQYGSRPGLLVVRVNLRQLDELMVSDESGIGLVCKATSEGRLPSCFYASTGQTSADRVLMGVSNKAEFMKMLKRLIVLHQ